MPREASEVLRLAFELFPEAGPEWQALHHPDIVVVAPSGWPEEEVLLDRDAWTRQARRLSEDWDDQRFDIQELRSLPAGRTLVLFTWRTRGKGSQIEIESPMGGIATVRDGVIVRYEFFGDHDEARRAAGITI